MEETMLSVLRPAQKTSERVVSSPSTSPRPPVDPSELPPDKLHVEMELSPDSQITLYGPLLNAFLCIKVLRIVFFGFSRQDFSELLLDPPYLSTNLTFFLSASLSKKNKNKNKEQN